MNEVLNYWLNSEPKLQRPMPAIKRKVPFELKVVTERNEVWGYTIEHGKPKYYFLFSFFEELPMVGNQVITVYRPSLAVTKSIARHKRKIL